MVSITLLCMQMKMIRLGKNMMSALAAVIPCVTVELVLEENVVM